MYCDEIERALDQAVGAQRVHHLRLVAGELEVEVELDVAERRPRRGGRGPPRASSRRRSGARGRGRARAASCCRPASGPGRTSNSIMSTPAASAASKDARVLPGAIRSAPLWPTRRSGAARVSSDIAGTSRSCGCRPPGPSSGSARRRRSAGTAARRGRRRAGGASGCRRVADCCMRGRAASTIATASSSLTLPAGRQGSIPASKQASAFHRFPIPATVRCCEHGVADRPRGVVLAQPPQVALVVELGGEDVGPEAGDALVEARPRLRHQLEHGAVELHDLGAARGAGRARRRGASASSAARARRRATSPSSAGASGSSARPRSAGTGACRGRPPRRPRGPPGAPASGRARSAGAGSRARRARGPPAPAGCGARRSGSCRPRACLPAYGGLQVRLINRRSTSQMRNRRPRLSLLGQFSLLSLLLIVGLGGVLATVLESQIEHRALANAEQIARVTAQVGVAPRLVRARPHAPAVAAAAVAARHRAAPGRPQRRRARAREDLQRARGPRLLRRPHADRRERVRARTSCARRSEAGSRSEVEHGTDDTGAGRQVLEVYTPLRLGTGAGVDGALEIYLSYDARRGRDQPREAHALPLPRHRPGAALRGAVPDRRPRVAAAAPPRPPRRPDRPAEPHALPRARRARDRGQRARSARSRCCSSTSIASRRSTTRSGTTTATSC